MNGTKADSDAALNRAKQYDSDSQFVKDCDAFLQTRGYLTAEQCKALKSVGYPHAPSGYKNKRGY